MTNLFVFFVFVGYGDHREQHLRTHSFPTRRSSDLVTPFQAGTLVGGDLPKTPEWRLSVAPRYEASLGNGGSLVFLGDWSRSEEHTSELQSLMRISYAVFCLKKKTKDHVFHLLLQLKRNQQ